MDEQRWKEIIFQEKDKLFAFPGHARRIRISQKTDTKAEEGGAFATAQRDKSVRQEAKGRKFLTCVRVCVEEAAAETHS